MAVASGAVSYLCANVVLQFLAVVGVILRVVARRKKRQPLKADDWTIFVSLDSLSATSTVSRMVSTEYIGLLFPRVALFVFERFNWRQSSSAILSMDLSNFGRAALQANLRHWEVPSTPTLNYTLNQFIQFFTHATFLHHLYANLTLVAISIFMIISFFMILFCARGVTSFWKTPAMLEGTQYVLYPPTLITIFAVLDVALDICVLSLPFPIIRSLHLSRKRRFGVAAIFLLGAFCLVCSIIRLYYTRLLEGFTDRSIEEKQRLSEKNDLWAHIEAYSSAFTACLPTLRPIFSSGKDVQSLLGSMRSFFSVRSRSQGSLDKSHSSHGSERHELNDPSSLASEQKSWLNSYSHGSNNIIVEKAFSSGHE